MLQKKKHRKKADVGKVQFQSRFWTIHLKQLISLIIVKFWCSNALNFEPNFLTHLSRPNSFLNCAPDEAYLDLKFPGCQVSTDLLTGCCSRSTSPKLIHENPWKFRHQTLHASNRSTSSFPSHFLLLAFFNPLSVFEVLCSAQTDDIVPEYI